MPTTIIMPQLGESVAEGIIGKWLKQQGDHIEKDEPIVEIITDKVNAEIPSPVGGTLQKITQPEGATVAVGQEIAIIGDDGDSGSDAGGDAASSNGQQGNGSTAASSPVGERPVAGMPSGTSGQAQQVAVRPVTEAPHNARGERVRTSPLVKRLAEQYSINLAEVPGTGIGGRVSKQDIMSFIEQKQQEKETTTAAVAQPGHLTAGETFQRPATPRPPQAPARPPGPSEELVPVSPLRKIIAERMVLSKFTIPHAVTNHEVDMTSVVRFREEHKKEFQQKEGVPLSYVAFVIKATVDALKDFPLVNSEWAGDNIIIKKDININVAVDAPDGLTTPVIHHADDQSLAGLCKAIYDIAIRGRDKKLRIEDMQGGTFTVNNTGAIGSLEGVSIINYPQCGILSAGTIVKRPVVLEQEGQDVIAVRSMMILSLSFDHRILDGGTAAGFVDGVRAKLETWSPDYPIY